MNPILQNLRTNGNTMNGLKGLLSGDKNALYNQMLQNNPQFAQFVKENQGKTPEQVAQAYGIDINEKANPPAMLGRIE